MNIEQRSALALSEIIDPGFRPLLMVDQWNVIRCYFARRADLTQPEISQMIRDDDYIIRMCIAKRDDLTADMIDACVNDKDPNVRHAIARNPLLNDTQRQKLLTDIDELVSRAAAKGPRAVRYRQRTGQAKLIR